MPLHVAFLWHMHQPDYVDAIHGVALMPWVRLHATKGYLDMIWLVGQVPEFQCSFNITPVLIKQIQQLTSGRVCDLWHELATTPADDLTDDQRVSLLDHYFKANWQNMVKPHSRYGWLLQKRGTHAARADLPRIAREFSIQELRDLQAWYHLAWFGYAADRLYPDILELKRKGRDFTEADKAVIWARQQETLASVLTFYRQAAERGQVELTTTPFYHPILPLVYNTEFARRCMPGRTLPAQFARPEDVRLQLATARQLHTEVFGKAPDGLWPSEGSVCPELVSIVQELGFEWLATDEEILWRSLANDGANGVDRSALFQGYQAHVNGHFVTALFRDRNISDFIGFNAAHQPPQEAAASIVSQMEAIGRHTTMSDPMCAVVLDGENAWENFADGGESFLRALYERISQHKELKPTTVHGYLQHHPARETLAKLHTGSWIHADFDIWIGEPEENQAWDLLGETSEVFDKEMGRGTHSPEQLAMAREALSAAEGSDWFWWYGSDFTTENDSVFDELFRRHLESVYTALGLPVPDVLHTPITGKRPSLGMALQQPTDIIKPVIDGRNTTYYEWMNSGVYRASADLTTMYRGELILSQVLFGFDLERLYIRCDFRSRENIPQNLAIRVHCEGEIQSCLIIRPPANQAVVWNLVQGTADPGEASAKPQQNPAVLSRVQVAWDQVLEVGCPFDILGAKPGSGIELHLQVYEGDTERERHPLNGSIRVEVPDEMYAAMRWTV